MVEVCDEEVVELVDNKGAPELVVEVVVNDEVGMTLLVVVDEYGLPLEVVVVEVELDCVAPLVVEPVADVVDPVAEVVELVADEVVEPVVDGVAPVADVVVDEDPVVPLYQGVNRGE